MLGRVGVGVGQGCNHPIELGVHGRGVGLVEDGADLSGHVWLRRFGHPGQQVT